MDLILEELTGTNYLINVDYFKTTEWMTQSLIDALNTYQIKYNNYITQYTTTLNSYKKPHKMNSHNTNGFKNFRSSTELKKKRMEFMLQNILVLHLLVLQITLHILPRLIRQMY